MNEYLDKINVTPCLHSSTHTVSSFCGQRLHHFPLHLLSDHVTPWNQSCLCHLSFLLDRRGLVTRCVHCDQEHQGDQMILVDTCWYYA